MSDCAETVRGILQAFDDDRVVLLGAFFRKFLILAFKFATDVPG